MWRTVCTFFLKLRATGRNNSQHCWANNFVSSCVRVGSGGQTDATTPNNVRTCSASWKGYNPLDFGDHVQCACVAPTMLEEILKANESNIVTLRFSDHGTKEMLGVVG